MIQYNTLLTVLLTYLLKTSKMTLVTCFQGIVLELD